MALLALSEGIDTVTPGGRLFFHGWRQSPGPRMIVERTVDGLAVDGLAANRGRTGGPKFKMTAQHPVTASVTGCCRCCYFDWPGARSEGLPVASRHAEAPLGAPSPRPSWPK